MDDEGKTLILQFAASLCLCDHTGDVMDDIDYVLHKKLGLDIDWEDESTLLRELHKLGVTTLHGTSLEED